MMIRDVKDMCVFDLTLVMTDCGVLLDVNRSVVFVSVVVNL